MTSVYKDEIEILSTIYKQKFSLYKKALTFLLISDGNSISKYFLAVFEKLIIDYKNIKVVYLDIRPTMDNVSKNSDDIKKILTTEDLIWNDRPIITTFILNFKNRIYLEKDIRLNLLSLVKTIIRNQSLNLGHRIIFSSIMPDLSPWDKPITHLSEFELSEILKSSEKKSSAYLLYCLEKEFNNSNLKGLYYCLRYDNVFGPQIENINNMDFSYYISMISRKQLIEVKDNHRHYSCVYIRDILQFYLHCFFSHDYNKVYNFVSYHSSDTELVYTIYKLFPTLVQELILKRNNWPEQFHTLEDLKLKGLNYQSSLSFEEAVYRTFIDKYNLKYEIERINEKYHGHLNKIRQLELQIVLEIDKICQDNGINYFLVGGSLLGAVRHQGFIPWDDDIDIGMLRDDFEKFRKICPDLLPKQYFYQSYKTEYNSHYVFDKIRLKETYFSTRFSNKFPIENGVFVDILVYDKTSNHPFIQKLHIKLIQIMKQIINIRWVNKPKKNSHYFATVILLPIMRLIPFQLYHLLLEILIKFFNKMDTEYYIDSVGMNLTKGAFHKECILGKPLRVCFENIYLPIPAGSDLYLKHWYGNSYMEIPSISSRISGHDLVQIDLGKYLL